MSLVALALPQDPLRMKTMAEKNDLSPMGGTPVVCIAPQPGIHSEPLPGKKDKKEKSKHKKKQATKTLAQTSATASISIAISDPDAVLSCRSAPSSPEFLKPRRSRLKLKTKSKGANSDPESATSVSPSPSPSPSPVSSPNRRPLFLWPRKLGGKGRKGGSREVLNGPKTPGSRPGSPNVVDRFGSGSSIEPEATPATTLPGERASKLETRHSGGEIPTIFVSNEHNGCVELEVDVHAPDESRKMSQTSVGSAHNSANSGYCTLSAAGSGDEGGSFSDLECPSPVSPASVTSSPGGSVPNLTLMSIADAGPGSKRVSTCGTRSSSVLSPDSEPDYNMEDQGRDATPPITTPTTPLSAPLTMSVAPLPGPRGMSPPVEGQVKSPGRGRDPFKKRGVSHNLSTRSVEYLVVMSCNVLYVCIYMYIHVH